MNRRFQFSLTTLVLLAPAFVLGYVVGQTTAEKTLKADRARVVKKDMELKDKEARLRALYPPNMCGTP